MEKHLFSRPTRKLVLQRQGYGTSGSPVMTQLTIRSTVLDPRLFHTPLSSGAGFSGSRGIEESRLGRSSFWGELKSIFAARATRRSMMVKLLGAPAPPAPRGGFSGLRSIFRPSLDIPDRRCSVDLICCCPEHSSQTVAIGLVGVRLD
jgi:hypothetical protein